MIQRFVAAGIHVILHLSRGRKKRYNNCDLSEGREDSIVSVVECAVIWVCMGRTSTCETDTGT